MDSPSGAGWESLSREGVGQVPGKGQVVMVRARESGLIMTDKFLQQNLCPGLSLLSQFVGPRASSSQSTVT